MAPAATVGMVGGGQLARMTHQASIALAVELTVLDEAGSPAAQAGAHVIEGRADDAAALRALAAATDVVTFDHEQIPLAELEALAAQGRLVRPAPAAKRLAQDKLHARRTLAGLGLPVPAFAPATSRADVDRFAAEHGWPVVLKARSGGYDGRGVAVVDDPAAAAEALAAMRDDAVVEEHVAIARELAVLIARRPSGETAVYPVVETRQEDAQLRELIVGDSVPDAEALGVRIVEHADATGIVAVELFETADGGLLVNELALRPHNSGHWTIEGAVTSQFEQHLRAVLDWPLGATGLRAPAVATVNVLGQDGVDPRAGLSAALAVPGAHVHLYGKAPRPARKLGHVTALGDHADTALATARRAVAALEDVLMSVRVGITMGSDSDLPVMQPAADVLDELGVESELRVTSAHRTPDAMLAYGREAAGRGLHVLIAGAGGAAHLPGMLAAVTRLPVIGVPVALRHLDGVDSLLSIAQMPRGVPVATVAIDGGRNAGLLAARILALADPDLARRLDGFHADLAEAARQADDRVRERDG